MLGRTYESEVCSIARTLEIVGERWTLLIIRNAHFAGATRFRDFQQRLGIASNVLTTRLDWLVSAGIFDRKSTNGATEYLLTAQGRDLAPVLIALTEWGDRWLAPDGPPVHYEHQTCRHPVHIELTCADCGSLEAHDSILALPGPGMPPEPAARMLARLGPPASPDAASHMPTSDST